MKRYEEPFQLVLKVWWTWIKTFDIISSFYNLLYILMTKTNYDQSENFQKNWKENWKELYQPETAAFDH